MKISLGICSSIEPRYGDCVVFVESNRSQGGSKQEYLRQVTNLESIARIRARARDQRADDVIVSLRRIAVPAPFLHIVLRNPKALRK